MDAKNNTELFDFIDKLFLNIYSYLPTENVANFVAQYSNLLYLRYSPHKAEWTIYPPNHTEFKFETVKHTIEFNSHPFLQCELYKGQLEILNSEIDDEKQTQELRLTLFFRYKNEALKAIEQINRSMTEMKCQKREQTISKCLMVEYSSDGTDILSGISYKYGKDVFENSFNLVIYPNAYRIHFIK